MKKVQVITILPPVGYEVITDGREIYCYKGTDLIATFPHKTSDTLILAFLEKFKELDGEA